MFQIIQSLIGVFSAIMLGIAGSMMASGLWIADMIYQIFH